MRSGAVWCGRFEETIQGVPQGGPLSLLPLDSLYELHVFRYDTESPRTFNSRAELIRYLETIVYDGGTNYESLQAIAKTEFDGVTLLFSDGLDTYKHIIPEFGVHSSALLSGNNYDKRVLWSASHGHIIDLNDMNAGDAFAEIILPKLAVYNISGAHISDIQGVKRYVSDRVVVIGKWDGQSDSITITLSDGTLQTIELKKNDDLHTGRILATSWVIDRVKNLSAAIDKNSNEIIQLSKKYSVPSRFTKMVVLTNAKQWQLYDIEPPKNLTKIHEEYIQNKNISFNASEEGKVKSDSVFELPETWTRYLDWWKDPLPKEVVKTYRCSEDEPLKCSMTVSSEYGDIMKFHLIHLRIGIVMR